MSFNVFSLSDTVTYPLYSAASGSSFYTLFRFVRATCPDSAFVLAANPRTSCREPLVMCMFSTPTYPVANCLPARFTTFAVWIPKKMYRISVIFILALILRIA